MSKLQNNTCSIVRTIQVKIKERFKIIQSWLGLYMGPNNSSCVTRHFLLSFSVSHVTFYKNFTSSRHVL